MGSAKENSFLDVTSPQSSTTVKSDSLEPAKLNLKNIRPLTQAYQSPKTPTQVYLMSFPRQLTFNVK